MEALIEAERSLATSLETMLWSLGSLSSTAAAAAEGHTTSIAREGSDESGLKKEQEDRLVAALLQIFHSLPQPRSATVAQIATSFFANNHAAQPSVGQQHPQPPAASSPTFMLLVKAFEHALMTRL